MSSTKETVLNTLKKAGWISGQKLAQKAGVSRTAIWKQINSLRKDGYKIKSSSGLGYILQSTPELLPQEIKANLNTHFLGKQIFYYPEISSTQEAARTLVSQGAEEGCVVIAEKQTSGRGRMHRNWYSLPEGISLSIILKPDVSPSCAAQLSLLAGLGIIQAIEICTDLKAVLKWPNDIIISEKKAGGVLAELSAEMDRINFLILGMGLNVNSPHHLIPADIREQTTSLRIESGQTIDRPKLVSSLLCELEKLYTEYNRFGFQPIKDKWKKNNNTLGTWVEVNWPNQIEKGYAQDIDEHGSLILKTQEGKLINVTAGDISVRVNK